jgi:hypothetical protein
MRRPKRRACFAETEMHFAGKGISKRAYRSEQTLDRFITVLMVRFRTAPNLPMLSSPLFSPEIPDRSDLTN